MSLEIELKRRLDVKEQPLAKRLRLAENIISSSFFPVLNKDEIILEWIFTQIDKSTDVEDKEKHLTTLRNCLSKAIYYKKFSNKFKLQVYSILSQLLNSPVVNKELIIESCLNFLENPTVSSHIQQSLDKYFTFQTLLLNTILNGYKNSVNETCKYENLAKRALNDISNFIKNFGKKSNLVEAFIDCKTLKIILEFSKDSHFNYKALNICQTILFPKTSIQIYRSYLGALVKGINLSTLIEEKGESLRSIVKVLDIVFKYNLDIEDGCEFLINFIKLFIFCCKSEEIIVYFFNILLMKCIGVEQEYIEVFGNVSQIDFSKQQIEDIYYSNISLLSEFNINLNLTFSNTANNESEKNFITYLQQTMLNVLNCNKLTKTSLLIIESAILLDPMIFEPLIESVLPKICIEIKDDDSLSTYNSLMLTILSIQFKLSRGTEFIPRIVPYLKTELEKIDEQQSEYILKSKNSESSKYVKKIVKREGILTNDFCLSFGKLSSELMSWQNAIILNSLSELLSKYCIVNLSQNIAPSVILLTELICSLLNCFFLYTKMADQSLTQNVVKKFVEEVNTFEENILGTFGKAMTSINETRILFSYLDVCYTYGQFKLLLSRYQPYYTCPFVDDEGGVANEKKVKKIGDVSLLHPYLSSSEWKDLFTVVKNMNDSACNDAMNRLIIQKLTMLDLCEDNDNAQNLRSFLKTYIFENLESFWNVVMENNLNGRVLLADLTTEEVKLFSNKIVLKFLSDDVEFDKVVFKQFMERDFIINNKNVLSELILDASKVLWTIYDGQKNMKDYKSLSEASQNNEFDLRIFLKENIIDMQVYLKNLSESKVFKKYSTIQKIINIMDFLSLIPVEYLHEKYQYIFEFDIVTLKTLVNKQNLQESSEAIKNLDSIIEFNLFKMYELSYKVPNMLEIFPIQVLMDNVICLVDEDRKKISRHYTMFKLMFERLLTKDYVHQLKVIVKYLKKELSSMDSKSSEEKLKSSHFQMICLLYTSLTNFKKVSLPSDMKATISKAITDSREIILNVFDTMKWKYLSVNSSNMDTSQTDVNESMEVIENSYSMELSCLNVCECFALLLQSKLESKDDEDLKILKCLKKGLKCFINLVNNNLPSTDICLQHAKGCSVFINTILKHISQLETEKVLQNQQEFFTNIFAILFSFVQNNNKKCGSQWGDVLNTNLESIKLIFELSDDRVFSNTVSKYCSGDFSVHNGANISLENTMKVTKTLWTCLMNANLKSQNKSDMRVNVLKEIFESYRVICRDQDEREMENNNEGDVTNKKDDNGVNSKENMEKVVVCFQVATQFVSMKKIPLSSGVIDNIMQMPLMLSMESHGDQLPLEVFKEKFDLCANLINSLLIHRSELIQDRWPCFLQGYRKILKCLCHRSNSEKTIDNDDTEMFTSMAMTMERITQSMAKNEKQELSRISAYLVADIINSYHKIPVLPDVKFHIEKCVYSLFDLLDSHSIGFLMRNMQDSQRLVFQQIHQNYNRYYKYTGIS